MGVGTGLVFAPIAAQAFFTFNCSEALLFVGTMLALLSPIPLSVLGISRPKVAGRWMIGVGLASLVVLVSMTILKGAPQGVWPVVRFAMLGVSPFLVSGTLLLIAGKAR